MTTTTDTQDSHPRTGGLWRPVARALALLAIPFALAGMQLLQTPKRDVPAWRHITGADLARTTSYITWFTAFIIVLCGAGFVFASLLRSYDEAFLMGVMLVCAPAATVFFLPVLFLASRGAYCPGALDPVPVATDFNFRAYLPDLLSALVTPALWALGAAVVLGLILALILAAAVRFLPARRVATPSSEN